MNWGERVTKKSERESEGGNKIMGVFWFWGGKLCCHSKIKDVDVKGGWEGKKKKKGYNL